MISTSCGKFEIITDGTSPLWHIVSCKGKSINLMFSGDEIYDLFNAVSEHIGKLDREKISHLERGNAGLTESGIRKTVIDTLRELLSGTIGGELSDFTFNGVEFVDRVSKAACEIHKSGANTK